MKITEDDFRSDTIEKVKDELAKSGASYVVNDCEDNSEDFLQFLFIGKHEGKEVLFDAAAYTLHLHHESELYDTAEREAIKRFPEYRALILKGVEVQEGMLPAALEEEIGIYLTETMMDLEEEEAIKVKENLELDDELDHRVGLDISLHVEKISPQVVEKFIREFNSGTLKLDPTLYSFQSDDEDEE